MPRYASRLALSNETEQTARELLEVGVREGVHSGKHPVGLAATALSAAARLTDETLTQNEVSATADVSRVTLRNRYQALLAVAAED
ncbi:transcription initiation factor TFIIB [Natronobacterium gregoryi]|uniref:Transcription factor TFIIB cyclin-related protein n=2 Tax=Natronobacterium gregoryi TaxID=44930 RepID=L9YB27_NATGS|nr:transcription factor TFIIB cyclin-related protein [Natronobacterium gregoryi SP2]SFI57239.1 transcription initiation factor TFIIB [Natronobacterium gregoryi]